MKGKRGRQKQGVQKREGGQNDKRKAYCSENKTMVLRDLFLIDKCRCITIINI